MIELQVAIIRPVEYNENDNRIYLSRPSFHNAERRLLSWKNEEALNEEEKCAEGRTRDDRELQ